MNPVNIAIVGATGLVGRTFLQLIDEFDIPINQLRLFASPRSAGKQMSFKDQEYTIQAIEPGSFLGIDFALFSAGATISHQYAKQAQDEGAIVIDNSSAWRMNPGVPLVVPEVNMDAINGHTLIANPNCSTIQSVVPLYVIDQLYGLAQVEYNTYQAVSGSGQKGIDDLNRTKTGQAPSLYPYDISKTAIPQIDVFEDDGYTKEEHKMINETKKILNNDDLMVTATCVRVPVEHGHAISIRATLYEKPNLSVLRQELARVPGVKVLDDPKTNRYPTSVHAVGNNSIYVGRFRHDIIDNNAIAFYVVADNIRKGAALNAVQIMMELMNHA